jgi:hypothetical protein
MDVAVVRIDDIDYTIVEVINGYAYLIDLDNPNDFLIMKDEGEELVSITDENEFENALKLFSDKIAG